MCPVNACVSTDVSTWALRTWFRNPGQANVGWFTAQKNSPPCLHLPHLACTLLRACSFQRRAGVWHRCDGTTCSRHADVVSQAAGVQASAKLYDVSAQALRHLDPAFLPRRVLVLSDSGDFSALPIPLFLCPPLQLSQSRCGQSGREGVSHHVLRAALGS